MFITGLLFSYIVLNAQAWLQVGQDIDGDVAGDMSGYSVAVNTDGSVVAIGAYKNDDNGSDAGQVRVFRNNNGTWTQIGEDIEGMVDDGAGFSVSISSDGSTVAVGCPYSNQNGTMKGLVRVYKNINGSWEQIGPDIVGENDVDHFGYSVSLSADGEVVAVGAIYNSETGTWAGHVRVYRYDSNTWLQIGQDIDGEAAYDRFGYTVSLNSDGSVLAVGAPYNVGDAETGGGQVRVFRNENDSWVQVGQAINGSEYNEHSGNSVSLSADGTILAIGAPYNDGTGPDAGQVRIYRNENGTWTQLGQSINGEAAGDYSGYSVSLSDDGQTVAIGAIYNSGSYPNAGHVRVYTLLSGNWTKMGQDINGEAEGDYSGCSVSLSGDATTVAIGAYNNDGNGDNAGHVRVYKFDPTDVSDLKMPVFVVYPNPTDGDFTVELNNDFQVNKETLVEIYDVTGIKVYEKNLAGKKTYINTDLSNGIYFYQIKNRGKVLFTGKLVVRH